MSTGDSPERNFDEYVVGESLRPATPEDVEEASNSFQSEVTSDPSNSSGKPKSRRTPRREVWWVDLGATDQSLKSIKRCFENRLDRFLLSPSNSLLRRIRSAKDNNLKRNLHRCPGYLREEITLTSDVTRSAIVSHTFPSESELCSICGQLVQYTYSDPSVTDEETRKIPLSPDGWDEFNSKPEFDHTSLEMMNVDEMSAPAAFDVTPITTKSRTLPSISTNVDDLWYGSNLSPIDRCDSPIELYRDNPPLEERLLPDVVCVLQSFPFHTSRLMAQSI